MPNQPATTAPLDSLSYAESLYSYAAQQLDANSLRCWVIRRLMLDDGLDHARAEDVFEHVLASTPNENDARKARRFLMAQSARTRRRPANRPARPRSRR